MAEKRDAKELRDLPLAKFPASMVDNPTVNAIAYAVHLGIPVQIFLEAINRYYRDPKLLYHLKKILNSSTKVQELVYWWRRFQYSSLDQKFF